jgi:hypothetical protein
MTKLISAFRNYAKAPKNESCFVLSFATVSVTKNIYRMYQNEPDMLRENVLYIDITKEPISEAERLRR